MSTKKKPYNIRRYKGDLVEVEGYEIPNDYGMRIIAHKKLSFVDGRDLGWTVSDFWTGMSLLSERDYYGLKLTKNKAIEVFHERMAAYPQAVESYDRNVKANVKKYGYANQE